MKYVFTYLFLSITCLSFGQNQNDNKNIRDILKKAENLFEIEQYDSAYFYGKKVFKLYKDSPIDSFLIKAALFTAKSKHKISVNDSTDYIRIAKETAKKIKDWKALIEINYFEGNKYFENSENEIALSYFLRIDSIASEQNIINSTVIEGLIKRSEISRLGFTAESTDYAYILLNDALKLAKEMDFQDDIHYIYIYLADVSGLKGNYEEAKRYIDLALNYFLQKSDKKSEKSVIRLYLISTSYYKVIDRLDKTEESFINGINYARNTTNRLELAKLLYYYGHFQKEYLNTCKEALKNHIEAKNIFDELGKTEASDYERLVRDIAECNMEFGNYKVASEYFQYAYDLKSDLIKKRNHEISRRIESKYQSEKKEQKIALLSSQNELIEQQKKNQRNLLLGGIGLTSLAGIFFFILYRNRQQTTKKLKELDQLKSNFFANISHEFRTPLTLIATPLEKKLASKKLTTNDRTDFEMMQRNSKRLLHLVDQLLDLSKLEAGKLKLKISQGDLSLLLRSIASSFTHLTDQKNIDYSIRIDDMPAVWFDTVIIEKTVINLLSNAVKYTPENGEINFLAQRENKHVTIIVENSGSTLSKEKVARLFDRFYQVDESAEGAGIGLSIVKELIMLSHGTIAVDTTKKGHLRFTVRIPTANDHFNSDERITEDIQDTTTMHMSLPDKEPTAIDERTYAIDENQPILLIVEDNTDVRDFVNHSFSEDYQVIQAENGTIGIEKAIEYIPDIIISDIMMPETDGLTLCNQLKHDERTCHIPIILLTAKAEEEDEYKGLDTGADAYIVKPFNLKLLVTRVENLIRSREILRQRYGQEVILKPKDIAITNLDEQFLEKVQYVMDKELTEPYFNTEAFSKAVSMSRMQLHRKLKALTGLSASEFIRSQRLKLAASLLQKNNANISEIGYAVGFNDHAYFSKCFKDAYGCSPSEFIKNRL